DAVTDSDVIVLAQASMADAVTRTVTRIPVLSSPRPGLAAAAVAAR
ncbi:arylsulfatase, partial [Streptomyces sp. NPDC059802]